MKGRTVRLRNVDKVFYPGTGFTKGNVIEYYARVAPVLLPHLRGRPLTLKRYPDGAAGKHFYQKAAPAARPEWVSTARIRHGRKRVEYVVCNDLTTLLWLCNLANLEFHPFLADAARPDTPRVVAFDLDPGPPASLPDCARVALGLRDTLRESRLRASAKTSGVKGMQVYVPVNAATTYAQTRRFARNVAHRLHGEQPDRVTSNMRRELRGGKVLIDCSQNHPAKTTVSVCSLRAGPRPWGSTPVSWSEVEGAADRREDLRFDADEILARVARRGDLFRPVLETRQKLPESPKPPP